MPGKLQEKHHNLPPHQETKLGPGPPESAGQPDEQGTDKIQP